MDPWFHFTATSRISEYVNYTDMISGLLSDVNLTDNSKRLADLFDAYCQILLIISHWMKYFSRLFKIHDVFGKPKSSIGSDRL